MTRTREESLREAQTHFGPMVTHAQGDLTVQLVIDAVCMRLSAGVEALARLDAPTRDRLFGDAWPLRWGMRNRIAHGYLLADARLQPSAGPGGHRGASPESCAAGSPPAYRHFGSAASRTRGTDTTTEPTTPEAGGSATPAASQWTTEVAGTMHAAEVG